MKKIIKKQRTTITILLIIITILSVLCVYFNLERKNQNYKLKDINIYSDGRLIGDYDFSHLYGKYSFEFNGETYNDDRVIHIGKSINDCYIDYSNKNNIKELNIYVFNNNTSYDDNGYGSPIVYVLDFVLKDNSHRVVSGYPQEGSIYFKELGYENEGNGIYYKN